jgi:hypothetical protein
LADQAAALGVAAPCIDLGEEAAEAVVAQRVQGQGGGGRLAKGRHGVFEARFS